MEGFLGKMTTMAVTALAFPGATLQLTSLHRPAQNSEVNCLRTPAISVNPRTVAKSFKPFLRNALTPITNVNNLDLLGAEGMTGTFELGVVNNAIYASYCQHCFHELCQSIGLSLDAIARSGNAFAVSEASLKYLAPLRSGENFVVTARMASSSALRLFFEHSIYRLPNRDPILEAKSTVVFLDKSYRPSRFPSDFKSKFSMFLHNNE